jgi:hypothetical protein
VARIAWQIADKAYIHQVHVTVLLLDAYARRRRDRWPPRCGLPASSSPPRWQSRSASPRRWSPWRPWWLPACLPPRPRRARAGSSAHAYRAARPRESRDRHEPRKDCRGVLLPAHAGQILLSERAAINALCHQAERLRPRTWGLLPAWSPWR